MKSRPFEVARLGELERFENEVAPIPVRIPLGIRAFGVNAYAAREEGGRIIGEHDVPGWAQTDSDLDAIRGEPGFPA